MRQIAGAFLVVMLCGIHGAPQEKSVTVNVPTDAIIFPDDSTSNNRIVPENKTGSSESHPKEASSSNKTQSPKERQGFPRDLDPRESRQLGNHKFGFGNEANGASFGSSISHGPQGISASFSASQSASLGGLGGGSASQAASQSHSFNFGPGGFSGSSSASQSASQSHNLIGGFGPSLSASQASSQSSSFGLGPGGAAAASASSNAASFGGGAGSAAASGASSQSFSVPGFGTYVGPYRRRQHFHRRRPGYYYRHRG